MIKTLYHRVSPICTLCGFTLPIIIIVVVIVIIIVIVIVIIIVIIVHHLWTQVALLCPIL